MMIRSNPCCDTISSHVCPTLLHSPQDHQMFNQSTYVLTMLLLHPLYPCCHVCQYSYNDDQSHYSNTHHPLSSSALSILLFLSHIDQYCCYHPLCRTQYSSIFNHRILINHSIQLCSSLFIHHMSLITSQLISSDLKNTSIITTLQSIPSLDHPVVSILLFPSQLLFDIISWSPFTTINSI